MSRAFRGRLCFLIFFLLGSVWWIYSICFSYKLPEKGEENTLNDKFFEEIDTYPFIMETNQEELLAKGKGIKETVAHHSVRENIQAGTTEKANENANASNVVTTPISKTIPEKNNEHFIPENDEDQKLLKELKKMLQANSLSKDVKFEEDFLRLYIISNNRETEKAFHKLINLLNLKIEHDELFHNIDFDFTQNPEYRFMTLLPHRNTDGSATILIEMAKWDPSKVPLLHLKRIMFMTYMQELRNPLTQTSGFHVIYDFADIGFKYVKYASPENLYLLNHVAHEVMPITFVGIHLVNINFLANLLITLIRPFIPPFIERVFYVHASVKKLHTFFPVSKLPVKYGGQLEDYYWADWMRRANEQHDNYPVSGQKNVPVT